MNFAVGKAPAMEVLSMIKHTLVTNEGTNPITKHFTLGKHSGCAGPELVWKIFEATRNSDCKEVSVFMFEKRIADKLHKPKRREMVTEILRREVKNLLRVKHPKILKVIHPLEECHDSIAFATEPVLASLANLLGFVDRMPANISQEMKDHSFLEIESKYGILQIAEALRYLHMSEHLRHGNVCPSSIIVTKRGMWKLAGLGFAEKPKEGKQEQFALSPWSTKSPKMAQPDLDYLAPEIQLETTKYGTTLSDMFSLGITICAIYNNGHSIIQANHNPTTYAKKTEMMTELFSEVAHKMPLQLVEPVEKMINKDIRYRPTAQQFMMLKYFEDLVVRCMQMIDAVESKDLPQKIEFFTKLAQAIPQFPRKLLYNSVFPMLIEQLEYGDMLIMVLPSLLCMIEHASIEDYKLLILPDFRRVFTMSRPVQATVYLLEKLDVIMAKSSEDDIKSDVLPMIFSTLESNSIQGQEAAINVFSTIKRYLDDQTMRKLVLPKSKSIFNKSSNVRTKLNALSCVHRLLDSLDKMMILDEVLPFLTEIQCQDVDIIMSVIGIYKHMLQDKKYGLTQNLLATKVMPTLIPYTATPGLEVEQFGLLMEVLRDMLDQIDRQRRSKMISEAPDNRALEMRRTSIDMRYNVFDPPKQEGALPCAAGNKYLLSVEEAYSNRGRRKSFDYRGAYNKYGYRQAPSTPELQTRNSAESLGPKAYRRHSSFQGLGSEEQAVLDKIVRERRASLAPNNQQLGTPHIMVSEASGTDLTDAFFFGNPRRASTQSMGPVVEPGRRDSRGRLLDLPNQQRRSSFQGICESAMQFFVGK